MASPPTVVTSRRRQHELLRSWTGWPLTSILIDPAEVGQVREAGWSGTHRVDPETRESGSWVRPPASGRRRRLLAILYTKSTGEVAAMYPDFLVFRRDRAGGIVDPHGLHLEDAPAKAKALAKYAHRHGTAFGRMSMMVYDRDAERHVTLDLRRSGDQEPGTTVTTTVHLQSLFDLAGARLTQTGTLLAVLSNPPTTPGERPLARVQLAR